MNANLDVTAVSLFMLVVFPGLISINVYRLIMPARPLDWTNALLQGLFYSTLIFGLAVPILSIMIYGADPVQHPVRYATAALLVLIVTPVLWPVLIVAAFRSGRLPRRIRLTYPTAWDFFFDRPKPTIVLVHLTDGALLAGLWGPGSYAGSFPNDGDIYLEKVYATGEDGVGEPIQNTRGVLLQKSQYSYIEFFEVTESAMGEVARG
ncbi:MAG TPA: DUF6338 family protein [Longimicrobium sp.]|nr:DUF6338 family protein [Longimicrobium sp.]